MSDKCLCVFVIFKSLITDSLFTVMYWHHDTITNTGLTLDCIFVTGVHTDWNSSNRSVPTKWWYQALLVSGSLVKDTGGGGTTGRRYSELTPLLLLLCGKLLTTDSVFFFSFWLHYKQTHQLFFCCISQKKVASSLAVTTSNHGCHQTEPRCLAASVCVFNCPLLGVISPLFGYLQIRSCHSGT